jgi:hypothetical protein
MQYITGTKPFCQSFFRRLRRIFLENFVKVLRKEYFSSCALEKDLCCPKDMTCVLRPHSFFSALARKERTRRARGKKEKGRPQVVYGPAPRRPRISRLRSRRCLIV